MNYARTLVFYEGSGARHAHVYARTHLNYEGSGAVFTRMSRFVFMYICTLADARTLVFYGTLGLQTNLNFR